VLFPDINFVPPDRYPSDATIRAVSERIAQGLDITSATVGDRDGESMAMSNVMADRDEDFNTRYASFRGWQMAIQKVKPIPRDTARLDLTSIVRAQGIETTAEVVDTFVARFLSVPVKPEDRQRLIEFLNNELGTDRIRVAETYLEEPLRMLVHLIMSMPEYQLG
jgi:hypothetical protein